MKIGPRYKIAKRLGPSVFDKTQGQKFALAESRSQKKAGRMPPKSDYGKQFLEKQRVRFFYGITEKQFKNYIDKALESKKPGDALFSALETRLDNVIYRVGLAKSRRGARQMVSHGHIMVNDKKVTIPSFHVSKGDTFTIREGSAGSPLFLELSEKLKETRSPEWLTFDPGAKKGEVVGSPVYTKIGIPYDLAAVLEFYSR